MDTTLQELRRRAAQTGSLEDRAAELRARVRAGELAQEMLELAAYCGDEAARLVVDPGHRVGTYFYLPPKPDRPHGIHGDGVRFDEFSTDLGRWGPAVLVRAAVAAARCALSKSAPCPGGGGAWRARPDGACECGYGYGGHVALGSPVKREQLAAIESAEAWLTCPCEPHWIAWREMQVDLVQARGAGTFVPNPEDDPHIFPQRALRAAGIAGEAPVRDAIRTALVAWALSSEAA